MAQKPARLRHSGGKATKSSTELSRTSNPHKHGKLGWHAKSIKHSKNYKRRTDDNSAECGALI